MKDIFKIILLCVIAIVGIKVIYIVSPTLYAIIPLACFCIAGIGIVVDDIRRDI